MESEWLVCMQCDTEFEFDEKEQVRYTEKGYDAPHRCPECRKHKSKIIYLNTKKECKNRRSFHKDNKEWEYWEGGK